MFPPVHTGIFIICKDSFPRLFRTRQGVSWPDYESVFSITRPCSEACHSPPQLLPLAVPSQPDNCPISAACGWRQGSVVADLAAGQSCPWAELQQVVPGTLGHGPGEALWVGGEGSLVGALDWA